MAERLEVGCSYRAIGPAADAQVVKVVAVDEDAGRYRTEGARQVAGVIAFGAEDMWQPVLEVAPAAGAWHDGRLVAFDVETTGVDLETARIVTAAVAMVGGGAAPETRTWLADPGVEIPDEAAEVHGITTGHAREHGQPAPQVIAEILDMLAFRPAGAPIVAFNARFDLTILDREARRYGLVPLGERGELLVVDPLVIDKWLHRYRKGSRKLDAQCAHYGAKLDDAHAADADAVAAARVAWCIGHRGEVIRRVRHGGDAVELRRLKAEWDRVRDDLVALHDVQVVWAAEQAAGLEEYFREQGTLEGPVEREWPVVSVPSAEAIAA